MVLLLAVGYLLIMGTGLLSMSVLYLRGKKADCNRYYLICQGLAILWCASQIFLLLSEKQWQLEISFLLGNFGICFVGAFWFCFAVSYAGKRKPKRMEYLPVLLSCVHYFLVLTNRWHHLYYIRFDGEEIIHGVFFYTNVFTTYLFVLAGAVILYRSLSAQGGRRTARWLVIASVLVPVAMNLFYLTGCVDSSFDITPLGFGISAVFILLATIRYRFLEVNVTAFDTILSGLSEGVGIFDKRGRMTYSNREFYSLSSLCGTKDLTADGVMEYFAALDVPQGLQKGQEAVFLDRQERYLQLEIYQAGQEEGKSVGSFLPCKEMLPGRETVFVIRDISRYYELLHRTRELAVTSEKLALEQERNRIAGEVHDTVGHTLTMIQSYLKLAAISVSKQETGDAGEYLEEARFLAGNGLRELRQSINQLRREASSELVTQGVLQLADQVKEIETEVTVQGEDSEEYSHLSRIVYECVRESITNALKYAEADKMEIIIRFLPELIELMIADDGKGCGDIVESNGIHGIRERVEKAGGQVRFQSSPGEGFLTRIKLPI